jgi:uncharacterized protein (DUF433 family)
MERIVIDPDICNGKPTIHGTRITIQTVLEFLAAGDSIGSILKEYPSLSREDVLAFIDFDKRAIKETNRLISIPGMRASIRKGLKTSAKKLSKRVNW